jgi:NNP family nitrate/nitrite transporter-like MFS transporter
MIGTKKPSIFGRSFAATGGPNAALWIFTALYLLGLALNYWYYWRSGAEKPC